MNNHSGKHCNQSNVIAAAFPMSQRDDICLENPTNQTNPSSSIPSIHNHQYKRLVEENLEKAHNTDQHFSWCKYQGGRNGDRRQYFWWFNIVKFFWSFSVIFLVTLLTALVLLGISLWLCNHFIIQSGVTSVIKQQREFLSLRVVNHVDNFVSQAPSAIQTVIKDLGRGDRIGLNFSDPRIDKSRTIQTILLFSQLTNPTITDMLYGTFFNYFTGVRINDTAYPPKKFGRGISNGDGKLLRYPMNDQLDIAPKPTKFSTSFYPTKRSWYLVVQRNLTIQWGQILLTDTTPKALTLLVSGPLFNEGTLFGVVAAGIKINTLAQYLSSIDVFPETRLFIVQNNMYLVSTNYGNVTDKSDPANPQLVDARNSSDLVIRESAEMIVEAFTLPLSLSNRTLHNLKFQDSTGQNRQIQIVGYQDQYGLQWNIVSVISENVILEVVHTSNRVVIIVTFCTIVIALIFATIISVLIAIPMFELAREFVKITKMNFNKRRKKIHSLSFFEIAVMTQSIKQLKNGLLYFDAFVPSDVVRVLVLRNASAQLGVLKRRMTIMFVNIQFSSTDDLSPNVVANMLQIMFTSLSHIVTTEGGVIDKYLSEGFMCLFNAPLNVDNHEVRSIQASLRMIQRIEELNDNWTKEGLPTLSINIGVNTDECYVGNVGSRKRVNYTALGDAVNVASRLVPLNIRYDSSIIIGPKTREAAQHLFVCRWIACLQVKGKTQPIDVYQVVIEREKASDQQKQMEVLVSHVKQAIESNDLASAHSLVLSLLTWYPNDKALIELQQRLESPNFSVSLELSSK